MNPIIPLLIVLGLLTIFVVCFLRTFIPYFKQDVAWERYNIAWNEWYHGGQNGKMPVPSDYGYKTEGERNDTTYN